MKRIQRFSGKEGPGRSAATFGVALILLGTSVGCATLRDSPSQRGTDVDLADTGRYLDQDTAAQAGGVSNYVDKYAPEHRHDIMYRSSKTSKYRAQDVARRLGGVDGYIDDLSAIDEQALNASVGEPVASAQPARSAQENMAEENENESEAGVAPGNSAFSTREQIFFDRDSAQIKAEYEGKRLSVVIAELKADPNEKVRLEGHADDTGDAQHNQVLSEQRAQAVQAYLLDQGVNRDQVAARGLGEDDAAGASHRRTDIKVVKPTG